VIDEKLVEETKDEFVAIYSDEEEDGDQFIGD
jgi:hypothetical protein